jgi:hypothetical protein
MDNYNGTGHNSGTLRGIVLIAIPVSPSIQEKALGNERVVIGAERLLGSFQLSGLVWFEL